jgi:endoglucanase
MIAEGHYVGPHSDGHLLYIPWENRDTLLVTKEQFNDDLKNEHIAALQEGRAEEGGAPLVPRAL